jgi:hypothetical protein
LNVPVWFVGLNRYNEAQNPLYCAIKELGRIVKTLFVLRYIDFAQLLFRSNNFLSLTHRIRTIGRTFPNGKSYIELGTIYSLADTFRSYSTCNNKMQLILI